MKFSDITGHARQIENLRNMVDNNKIPHALLLHGLPGVGKMRVTRALLSYICCENRFNGDSCGVCPSCRQVNSLNLPDIHYSFPILKKNGSKNPLSIDYLEEWKDFLDNYSFMPTEKWLEIINAGNSQPTYYVTEADEISRISSLSAYNSKYKIFVIWLPEKMESSVANKLLKIIEEPFSDTLFILVSNDASQILPTIFSRCQRIAFNRLGDEEITDTLINMGLSEVKSAEVARLAQGKLSKALELASHDGETEEFGNYFRTSMRNAYARNVAELKRLSDSFAALGREKSLRLLDYFSSQVRENFIYNLHTPSLNMLNPSEEEFSRKFAPFIHVANVEKIVNEITRTRRDISRNANSKLVWFDFLLHLLTYIRIPLPK